MKVGIIGYGYVGQAMHSILKDDVTTCIVDPYKEVVNNSDITKVYDADIVFVCVGTPQDPQGNINLTGFNDVMKHLENYDGIVVIKSTILAELIPDRGNIVYNPEFLGQNNFIDDMKRTSIIILGGLVNITRQVESFYEHNTMLSVDKYFYCSIREASDFKYIRNIRQAYNVLFWSFVQDTTGNARLHADIMKLLPVGENSQVGMDGCLGYGGACLPKDVNAYNNSRGHSLTRWMNKYNDELSKINLCIPKQ